MANRNRIRGGNATEVNALAKFMQMTPNERQRWIAQAQQSARASRNPEAIHAAATMEPMPQIKPVYPREGDACTGVIRRWNNQAAYGYIAVTGIRVDRDVMLDVHVLRRSIRWPSDRPIRNLYEGDEVRFNFGKQIRVNPGAPWQWTARNVEIISPAVAADDIEMKPRATFRNVGGSTVTA